MSEASTPTPPEAAPPRAEPRRAASPLARATLLAYIFLIVYASWYPFTGWRSNGLSPLVFLERLEMPHYWTWFDIGINIVGYVPLGALIVYALHPRLRGALAVLVACACGVALSGAMEAVQSYLPSRVPSILDFATNAAGCCAGALGGALSAVKLLDRSGLYRLRRHWFARHASQGLVLLALWPLAQIYPQGYLFGLGQLLPILSDWLSGLLDMEIDLGAWLHPAGAVLTVEQYWLAETIITACGMAGAVLTLLCMLRPGAPRALLAGALVGAALLVKTLASALLFAPENALLWITPGARSGLAIGLVMLGGLSFAPAAAQRRLAAVSLLLSLGVINTTPLNPYFLSTLQGWVQGKFLNFNGAAQFLSLLWPCFALWFLWLPSHKLNRPEAP